MTQAHLAPDLTAALWQAAHDWLAGVLRAFGQPARMARLAHTACAALKRELKALESLVLKLLLIEASHLHSFPDARAARGPGPMNTPVAERDAARAVPCIHAKMVMDPGLGASRQSGNGWVEDPANPETWRVRFSLRLPQIPPRRRHAPTRRPRPTRPASALELARRCEALRRVLADPTSAVARLARKLRKLGARAYAAARRIALLRPRDLPCTAMLYAHACVRAHDGAHHFRGSG
jgi:hypothetical protein